MRVFPRLAGFCVLSVAVSAAAIAGDTIAYRYDALGRLVASTVTRDGASTIAGTTIAYDPAGNRSSYRMTVGGTPSPTPAPTPTPTPAPTPTPTPPPTPAPTALNPTINLNTGGSTSIAVATLASSSVSQSIVSFSPSSGSGTASIAAGGQSVSYTAPTLANPPACEAPVTKTFSVPYSVQNAGGTTSGVLTANVTSAAGPTPKPPAQCN